MGLSLRIGIYGTYWGNDYYSSDYLTQTQMEINSTYIYGALNREHWTLNAISGMLGNMQAESSINPGRWEGNAVGVGPGYGLVQWTPYTNYTNWATGQGLDPSAMDSNLARILYEVQNNLQWIPTTVYNFSFADFTVSTQTPEYLASAFLKNYERAGVEVESQRQANARAWYTYLGGITPPTPTPTQTEEHRFKWVLYARKLREKPFNLY